MKIFPLGASDRCSAPSVDLGPPHISKTVRARKLKVYTHRQGQILFGNDFSARGCVRGAAHPTLHLGPHHISEIVRARNLKFYTHLDRVRHTYRV